MSEVYEVKHVSGPKEWQGSHGPMLSYKLDLDNNGVLERQVELNRKPESRAPAVGELLALDLQETAYGTKAKLDFDRTKELGQPTLQTTTPPGGSSEVKTSSKWQPESERDPERAARILRQHSQEMALRAIALEFELHKSVAPADYSFQDELTEWTDWFDQDVNQAGQQARQEPRTEVAQSPETASGSDSPASPDAGDILPASLQEMGEALSTAAPNLPVAARDVIAAYMVDQLSGEPERLKKAVANLTLTNRGEIDPTGVQAKTLSALESAAETWSGKPLPQGDALDGDDDAPPF